MDRLLVVATALGALLIMSTGANATPATTCQAAAARDKRVNYIFCVSHLSAKNGSAGADAWGLAKLAAYTGSEYASTTEAEIKAMLQNPRTDPKAKGALEECSMSLHHATNSFRLAGDFIDIRDYDAAKVSAAWIAPLMYHCDQSFAGAGLPSPIFRQCADSVQFAVICTVITDLIVR